ncbi:MAG TPA: YqhA family protein [Thermoanaerobaculia bacterium]|nr:YqhA family protein [Thermoanaerobaculia bacterium]
MIRIEALFEKLLWHSRLVVLVPVIASLVVSFGMFYVSTMDVGTLVGHILHYHDTTDAARTEARSAIVAHVVEVVDGYLLATIMLIFALGLYELFVSRIEIAEGSEFASRLLLIRSLDDLKDRLTKVVLVILVVKFFEYALQLPFQAPIDLFWLALGVMLVSLALWLSHLKSNGKQV